jgi:6-phosphofructo-2-kinase / fructose-2,6-biphosphatase 4
MEIRKQVLEGCEKMIWDFFEHGQVVIYDANNGTRAARERLAQKFDKEGVHVIFLGECSLHIIYLSLC